MSVNIGIENVKKGLLFIINYRFYRHINTYTTVSLEKLKHGLRKGELCIISKLITYL